MNPLPLPYDWSIDTEARRVAQELRYLSNRLEMPMTPQRALTLACAVRHAAQRIAALGEPSVSQAVFDSPEARLVQERGHREACEELARSAPGPGNPNHPMYDLQLFGEHHSKFPRRQYR